MSEPIRTEIPEIEKEAASEIPQPMAWHRFLTRFMLYLAAAVHIFQAVWVFSGNIYYTPEIRRQIYAGIPAMRWVDIVLAACMLMAADMQLVARKELKKQSWLGVKLLTAAYAVLAASQLLYALARLVFAGLSPLSLPVIAQTLAYASLLLVNRSYYLRRRGVFGKETK